MSFHHPMTTSSLQQHPPPPSLSFSPTSPQQQNSLNISPNFSSSFHHAHSLRDDSSTVVASTSTMGGHSTSSPFASLSHLGSFLPVSSASDPFSSRGLGIPGISIRDKEKEEDEEEEATILRVVGIAFVMEEVGKGARLLFRYPANNPIRNTTTASTTVAATTTTTTTRRNSSNNVHQLATTSELSSSSETPSSKTTTKTTTNHVLFQKSSSSSLSPTAPPMVIESPPSSELFFSLSPRTIAKLFRLKPPLCGQPLTLTVGGTIFCCRAVLLQRDDDGGVHHPSSKKKDEDDDVDSSEEEEEGGDDGDEEENDARGRGNTNFEQNSSSSSLVLFSIIVALAPSKQRKKRHKSTQRRSNQAWGSTASYPTLSEYSKGNLNNIPTGSPSPSAATTRNTNPTFAAVKRIHLSLARLCRVLHREENRCHYVSRESKRMIDIQRNFKLGEVSTRVRTTDNSTSISKHKDANAGVDGNDTLNSRNGKEGKDHDIRDANTGNNNASNSSSDAIHTKSSSVRSSSSSSQPKISSASSSLLCGGGGINTSRSDDSTTSSNSTNMHSLDLPNKRREEENRQALVELMLASNQPRVTAHKSNRPINLYDDNDDSSSDDDDIMNGNKKSPYFGNLAQDIANTYHALSRKSNDMLGFLPSPSSLLGAAGGKDITGGGNDSGSSGVVYVNGHIAVPIEDIVTLSSSLSLSATSHGVNNGGNGNTPQAIVQSILSPQSPLDKDSLDEIRPYHTLLFPHASPSELLRAMSVGMTGGANNTVTTNNNSVSPNSNYSSGGNKNSCNSTHASSSSWGISSSSQRLQRFLSSCSPRKTLEEISIDAALPLFVSTEIATHLIDRNVCVKSHVINRSSRFACEEGVIKKMKSMSLPFAQKFGGGSSSSSSVGVEGTGGGGGGSSGGAGGERRMKRVVPIFMVVSAITSPTSKCLGDIMAESSSGVVESSSSTMNSNNSAGRGSASDEGGGSGGASVTSGENSVSRNITSGDAAGGGNNSSIIRILGKRIAASFGETLVTSAPPQPPTTQPPKLPTMNDPMQKNLLNHSMRGNKSMQQIFVGSINTNINSSNGVSGPSSLPSPSRTGSGGVSTAGPEGGGVQNISSTAAASAGGTVEPAALDVVADVEDTIYAMAVWLRSHSITVEVNEYFVSIGVSRASARGISPSKSSGGHLAGVDGSSGDEAGVDGGIGGPSLSQPPENLQTAQTTGNQFIISPSNERDWMLISDLQQHNTAATAAGMVTGATPILSSASPWATTTRRCQEEILHEELVESGCLLGNISTVAMSWKLGIDLRRIRRFRDWGVREKKIDVITRVPMPGDDWGSL
mmetsp:Transcript_16231/g.23820  ORF Transcript_16231/g.23820 Transcript_16231/m.23820 type:complete len:1323 (+) Transcript_16231:33-4001(+)